MTFKSVWAFLAGIFILSTTACVGPTTPFGSINSLGFDSDSNKSKDLKSISNNKYPKIIFSPARQVLHDRSEMSVEIVDRVQRPVPEKVKIYYNKRDVTKKFFSNSDIYWADDNQRLIMNFKNLRLKLMEKNNIQVSYGSGAKDKKIVSYKPPVCSLFEKNQVRNTGSFQPPKRYIAMINDTLKETDYNPNFLAGVVAQESAFNPKAVSWAKAIGLTQVTPIAEKEIIKNFKDWPRYPRINKMSYMRIKSKIISGQILPDEEWRLNPEYSLLGGFTYIEYLIRYWNMPKNLKVLESLKGDKNVNKSNVILASYNSGAARVKRIIKAKGEKWLHHKDLHEAHKYVKKVSSFCFHFSQGVGGDDS